MSEADKIQKQIEKQRKDLEWYVLHEFKNPKIKEFSEETLEKSRQVDNLVMEYLEIKNRMSEDKAKKEAKEKIEKNQEINENNEESR